MDCVNEHSVHGASTTCFCCRTRCGAGRHADKATSMHLTQMVLSRLVGQ